MGANGRDDLEDSFAISVDQKAGAFGTSRDSRAQRETGGDGVFGCARWAADLVGEPHAPRGQIGAHGAAVDERRESAVLCFPDPDGVMVLRPENHGVSSLRKMKKVEGDGVLLDPIDLNGGMGCGAPEG